MEDPEPTTPKIALETGLNREMRHFDAAHHLPSFPESHKCFGMHGHTYRVWFYLQGGDLDDRQVLIEYAELDHLWAKIHRKVDHKVLNEVPGLEDPTVEVLARWILMEVCALEVLQGRGFWLRVRVQEGLSGSADCAASIE